MYLSIIDKKYIDIHISDREIYENSPKMFVDFFTYKANLRTSWRDYNIFYFDIGMFGYRLALRFMWNFIERERTEKEEESYQRMQEFLKSVEETKEK